MKNSKDLVSEIEELSKQLGRPVPKNLSQAPQGTLEKMAEDLRADSARERGTAGTERAPGGGEPDESGAPAGGAVKRVPNVTEQPEGYAVAPGKSLTSSRGIIGPGTVVTAKDFQQGDQTIKELLESGSLVKTGGKQQQPQSGDPQQGGRGPQQSGPSGSGTKL
jgi:hypothetical protein